MSFNTALSGLNAATADLNVKSNNIANVNTTGFKQSRAEFADVYAVSAFGSSSTAIGSGTVLKNVAQTFKQGNLEFTDNALDLGISGEGFFAMAPGVNSGEVLYSRAGAFSVDKDGFVVNSSGQFLRTFPVNPDGSVSSTSMTSTVPLKLPNTSGAPQATSNLGLGLNLNAGATAIPAATVFSATDPSTFTNSTSVTTYDSLGDPLIMTTYYVKRAANEWDAYVETDGGAALTPATALGAPPATGFAGNPIKLEFNTSGTLVPIPPAVDNAVDLNFTALTSGAADMTITMDTAGSTQYTDPFNVNSLSQDGFPTGRLSGIDISDTGVVKANYSNGTSEPLGKVALASFANVQGLKQVGNTAWVETINSGEVLAGEAGSGSFGLIQAGALESSNIDLTKELVGLITAQRNFQANSKSIETENAITQTIINLR